MREYGSSYWEGTLKPQIMSAQESVLSTSDNYVSEINNNSDVYYPGVYSTCYDAASSAFNNLDSARDKLEDLLNILTSFYESVDETADSISASVDLITGVMSGINQSLTNLSQALSGSGVYAGVTITAGTLVDACSPARTVEEQLIEYYKQEFLNDDGSLNPDAVEGYFEESDAELANGNQPSPYRTIALGEAIDEYLESQNYSDEAYTEVANILIPAMSYRDYESQIPSIACGDGFDDVQYGDDQFTLCPDSRLSYITYTFRGSAQYFLTTYSASLRCEYLAGGYDYTDPDAELNEEFLRRTEFYNIMSSIVRSEHIALPYQITSEYREEHSVNNDRDDPSMLDTRGVEVDFYPGFVISRYNGDTSELLGSNNAPYSVYSVSYVTQTTEGPINGFITFDNDELGCPTNESYIGDTYVVTGDRNIGGVCDEYSTSYASSFLRANMYDTSIMNQLPIIGGTIAGGGQDLAIDAVDTAFDTTFGRWSIPVAVVGDLYDWVNEYTDQCNFNESASDTIDYIDNLDTEGNIYDNTACYGSYCIDNPNSADLAPTMSLIGNTYTNPRVAQLRLGYIASDNVSGTDNPVLVYDATDTECLNALGNSTNFYGYDNWLNGLKSYYDSLGCNKPFDSLTPAELRQIIDAYNAID